MKKIRPSRKRAFVVDRRKWGTGEEGGNLKRDDTGKMCCLGFVGLQCGVPAKNLLSLGTPEELDPKDAQKFPAPFITLRVDEWGNTIQTYEDGPLINDATGINDDDEISDKMREYKLKRLFKKHGCSIRFTH